MKDIVSYSGKILFEPENKTKKHENQAAWKKVAMVLIEGDLTDYYSWFLKKRFSLDLNKPLRGAHITFVNDSINDMSGNGLKTNEEVETIWENVKKKWDGKDIEIVLNLRPFSDNLHWWLIVDHAYREELHNIRAELGLGKPYFGLHMSIGYANEKNLAHSEYINLLNEKGFIELNKDYGTNI